MKLAHINIVVITKLWKLIEHKSKVWKLKSSTHILTNKTNIINLQLIVHDFPNTNGVELGGSSAKCVVLEH